MNTRLLRTTLILATACLGACGSINTYTAGAGASPGEVPFEVQVSDALTYSSLKADAVRFARTPDGHQKAQVTVLSTDIRSRSFAYRFDWIDDDGMVVDLPSATWKTATVPAGGSVVLSSVSPLADATRFKLQTQRSN